MLAVILRSLCPVCGFKDTTAVQQIQDNPGPTDASFKQPEQFPQDLDGACK